MWQNTCLSLSCKTYLPYNGIYLPEVSISLSRIPAKITSSLLWAMYIGRNASLAKIITNIEFEHLGSMSQYDVRPNKSASLLFRKSKFGVNFLVVNCASVLFKWLFASLVQFSFVQNVQNILNAHNLIITIESTIEWRGLVQFYSVESRS